MEKDYKELNFGKESVQAPSFLREAKVIAAGVGELKSVEVAGGAPTIYNPQAASRGVDLA